MCLASFLPDVIHILLLQVTVITEVYPWETPHICSCQTVLRYICGSGEEEWQSSPVRHPLASCCSGHLPTPLSYKYVCTFIPISINICFISQPFILGDDSPATCSPSSHYPTLCLQLAPLWSKVLYNSLS